MPIKITMPALSPTMTEGNLAKWLKKEGDAVSAGDVIAEIETDKATMEFEAVDEGTLAKIVVPEGTGNVKVNEVIAILAGDGEDIESSNFRSESSNLRSSEAPKGEPQESAGSQNQRSAESEEHKSSEMQNYGASGIRNRVFVSPLARRVAADAGIDVSTIDGSGPRGRVVKADVERAMATGAGNGPSVTGRPASSVPAGPGVREMADALGMEYDIIPNDNIRKIVARRLLESKQTVPHFYLTVECRIDALLEARKRINDEAEGAFKLSVNDFVIKAVAQALKAYPQANVAWTDDAILQYKNADISVAVATPSGLITPIVKKAETKGLRAISEEMKDLVRRARDGKLKPEEFQGGTFSVSNLGMYGIREFGAIINPPQSCILAVGAGEQKPFVENGEIKIGTFMHCTLSVDHRSVDGAVGAEFLKVFKDYTENPVRMLL